MFKFLTLALAAAPGLAAASYGPVLTYDAAFGGGYVQTAVVQPVGPSAAPVNSYCVVPQVLTTEAQQPGSTELVCAAK